MSFLFTNLSLQRERKHIKIVLQLLKPFSTNFCSPKTPTETNRTGPETRNHFCNGQEKLQKRSLSRPHRTRSYTSHRGIEHRCRFGSHQTLINPARVIEPNWAARFQLSLGDASSRLVSIARTISLLAIVETRSAIVNLNFVERLETEVILICDFCDARVVAERLKKRVIKLTDGNTVPILKKPQRRSENDVRVPDVQKYIASKSFSTRKVFAKKIVLLHPELQNLVIVSTSQVDLLQKQIYQKLNKTKQSSASHGIAQVEPKKNSNVNFGDKTIILLTGQQVATVDPQLLTIFESPPTHAVPFGVEEKEQHTYKKRNFSTSDSTLLN